MACATLPVWWHLAGTEGERMRIVQQWPDWLLGHFSGCDYKLLQFKDSQWDQHTVFSASDDATAREHVKRLVNVIDLEKPSWRISDGTSLLREWDFCGI